MYIYILYYHFMYILLQSDSKHTAYGRAEGETEEVDREGVCVCVYITLFCCRNIAKLCSRSLENDYYSI